MHMIDGAATWKAIQRFVFMAGFGTKATSGLDWRSDRAAGATGGILELGLVDPDRAIPGIRRAGSAGDDRAPACPPGPRRAVAADNVVIANPPDWPSADPPFVSIGTLTIQADAWGYILGHGLVLPLIGLDAPRVYAAEALDGAANFRLFHRRRRGRRRLVEDGALHIGEGDAHVVIPKLKADFDARIATQGEGDAAKIVVDAKGTYAAQPITARLVGGALLSLRDHAHPWPIDLTLTNGPTHVALNGTLEDPLAFKGANVRLQFSGPDMGLLEPLVGFPIPKTPAYQIAGKLDFEGLEKIRLENFRGRLGNSDIGGTIEEQPGETAVNGKSKPVVNMDLRSDRVDLVDLNGFIGGQPGRTTTANATPQQKAEVAKANANDKLLPDTPISVPRLNWADIHLRYHGAAYRGTEHATR